MSNQTPASLPASVISYLTLPTTFQRLSNFSLAPDAPPTAACCQASRYWKTPLAMALSTCTYRHFFIIWRMADLRQRRMASRAGDCADEAARCMSPCVPVAYNNQTMHSLTARADCPHRVPSPQIAAPCSSTIFRHRPRSRRLHSTATRERAREARCRYLTARRRQCAAR